MAHGYGYWTFGWLEAERAQERARNRNERAVRFNERWKRLKCIHESIKKDFVTKVEAYYHEWWANHERRAPPNRYYQLFSDVQGMDWNRDQIAGDIEAATWGELSQYAVEIKKTAMKAIKLCIETKIRPDIRTVEYDAKRKVVRINGRDLYNLA